MRRFLVFLVVLAVLLVGADFGARYVATQKIGEALQSRLGVGQPPTVDIAGFPFLLQAVRGEYGSVRAALPPETLGPLTDVRVSVELQRVRLPLSEALSGTVDRLTADAGRIRLTVPTAAVAAAVGLPGLTVTAQDGALVVGATVTVLGQSYPVTARLDAAVDDAALVLRSGELSGAGLTLPTEVTNALATLVDLTVPLDALPFRVTSGSVTVDGADVVVDATTGPLDLATG
ncbi:DUF2993 domain-containing protein [Nakamurella deserti]|uniref:LmeA family phospholipid-binding protein n=1 Tax=Nakamurella deserti TaxID=2164074 RepID=UPI000DBE6EF9|nr:DUF2993 domain-containing protein [Nakamurella deserti]